MNNETLATRIAQALFAVGATTASALVFQFNPKIRVVLP